jgi:hypothetical protein
MQQPGPPLSVVRQKVIGVFQRIGCGNGECAEKILLDSGYVAGRRFCQGSFQAVWLAGEIHISIFNEVGELIETKPLDEAEIPLKKAA